MENSAKNDTDSGNNLDYHQVYENFIHNGLLKTDYYVLMVLATLIATFGLLLDSTATVIGAMIVSPLMEPILELSFASLIRNRPMVFRASLVLISGIALSFGMSCLIASFFPALGTTSEILARTKPNILDLFVALSAGFLGAYVKVRRSISGTVYGAAIAIALVPPLCVAGIGFAYQEVSIYSGALLLFLTNFASILLSSLLAFTLIEIPKHRRELKFFIIPLTGLILLAIPLVLSFRTLIEEKELNKQLRSVLLTKTQTFEHVEIADTKVDLFQRPVKMTVRIRSTSDVITAHQVKLVQDYLVRKTGKPIQLIVDVMPILEITASKD